MFFSILKLEEIKIGIKKTESQFKRNYSLHDRANKIAEQELSKYGFSFKEFGEDRRDEYVWENGKDKPDGFIIYKNKKVCMIDWKGKNKELYCLNERAYNIST